MRVKSTDSVGLSSPYVDYYSKIVNVAFYHYFKLEPETGSS